MNPDILEDNPEPHGFAQFLGFVFLAAGSISLFAGATVLGWSLVWLVIALAALKRIWWLLRRLRRVLLAEPPETAWI